MGHGRWEICCRIVRLKSWSGTTHLQPAYPRRSPHVAGAQLNINSVAELVACFVAKQLKEAVALTIHGTAIIAATVAIAPVEVGGYQFCSLLDMEKNKANQERSRKSGGSSSFVDVGQPSRAPRQDEQGEDTVGSAHRGVDPGYADSAQQGISNRPAKDEHAFPEAHESDSHETPGDATNGPDQVGGNRGRV